MGWDHLQTLFVELIGAGIGGAIAATVRIRAVIRAENAPLVRRIEKVEARVGIPPATEEATAHAAG